MTARTRTPHIRTRDRGGRVEAPRVPTERIGWSGVPLRLRAAAGLAAASAALAVAGHRAGVLVGAPPPGAAVGAAPLLLAALPALVAIGLLAARRPVVAAGVLVGAAALAPGRALADAQFAVDALAAARPEITVPTTLAPLSPGVGLWLLLAGHAAAAAAGALALGRAGARPGTAYAAEFDDHSADRSTHARAASVRIAFPLAVAAAVGLLLSPFASDDAFVLARSFVDAPPLVLCGALAVAGAAATAAVIAAGTARPSVARGVVLGVTTAVACAAAPPIVAGLTVDLLRPAPGPYMALAAMIALTVAVWAFTWPEPAGEGQLDLDPRGLHPTAGVLGLLCGAACLVAALAPQLVVIDGLEAPSGYANRLLTPAALLVLITAAPLLAPRAAGAVRPAFAVALAAVPFAAAGAVDAAFTATGATDVVRVGPGVWFAGVAVALAAAAAVVAGIAGGAERDDVDLTERRVNTALAAPAAAAALLAVGAYGLPAMRAPDLVVPGIWRDFRFVSWGLLLALLAVLAAVALAAVSRPARAGALLLGAAGLVAVRLAEYPLTSGRAAGAAPGPGTWLALACAAALVVAAAVAVAARSRDRR